MRYSIEPIHREYADTSDNICTDELQRCRNHETQDKSALPGNREVRSFYLGTMAKDSPPFPF